MKMSIVLLVMILASLGATVWSEIERNDKICALINGVVDTYHSQPPSGPTGAKLQSYYEQTKKDLGC